MVSVVAGFWNLSNRRIDFRVCQDRLTPSVVAMTKINTSVPMSLVLQDVFSWCWARYKGFKYGPLNSRMNLGLEGKVYEQEDQCQFVYSETTLCQSNYTRYIIITHVCDPFIDPCKRSSSDNNRRRCTWNMGNIWVTLQCRHNERDVVSNHQPHDCILKRLFRRRSKKRHQSSVSLAFVWGIHWWIPRTKGQ